MTPAEFFDTDTTAPLKVQELVEAVKGLGNEQMDHLIAIARDLKR